MSLLTALIFVIRPLFTLVVNSFAFSLIFNFSQQSFNGKFSSWAEEYQKQIFCLIFLTLFHQAVQVNIIFYAVCISAQFGVGYLQSVSLVALQRSGVCSEVVFH